MAMSTEAARVEFSKMRAQISTIAEKVNELDQERNEYEYVSIM
jgi:flagellar biosynthesis chaperone FliJ